MGKQAFHVERQGKSFGPYSATDLRQMASDGKIKPDDLIRPDGKHTAHVAADVKGLFPLPPAGPDAASQDTTPPRDDQPLRCSQSQSSVADRQPASAGQSLGRILRIASVCFLVLGSGALGLGYMEFNRVVSEHDQEKKEVIESVNAFGIPRGGVAQWERFHQRLARELSEAEQGWVRNKNLGSMLAVVGLVCALGVFFCANCPGTTAKRQTVTQQRLLDSVTLSCLALVLLTSLIVKLPGSHSSQQTRALRFDGLYMRGNSTLLRFYSDGAVQYVATQRVRDDSEMCRRWFRSLGESRKNRRYSREVGEYTLHDYSHVQCSIPRGFNDSFQISGLLVEDGSLATDMGTFRFVSCERGNTSL